MKTCARCQLTALWQMWFIVEWRFNDNIRARIPTSYLTCGLCQETVNPSEFSEHSERIAYAISMGNPDTVRVSIDWSDISDGYWNDPMRTTEQRVPL